MHLVFGTKRKVGRLGWVANFCPICRAIEPFELKRIGSANHAYFLSLGEGKLICHIIECLRCGIKLRTDPTIYESLEENPARTGEIETLIQTTFPNLREARADRLAFEAELKRSPAGTSPDLRAKYRMEPFQLLNGELEQRYGSMTTFDKNSGLGCIGTVAVFGTLAGLAAWLHDRGDWEENLLKAAGICFVAGTLYTLLQLVLVPGRYLRTQVMPKLVRCLKPLDPTREELAGTMQKCRLLGMMIGKKVKLERLLDAIERAPTEG